MFKHTPRKIIIGLIGFLILSLYIYSQSNDLLKGPEISVDNLTNGTTVNTPFITLSGQAKRISKLYLNDDQIFTDDNGRFDQSLLLFSGYNILEIKATDAFGRKTLEILEIVLANTII